MGARAEALRVPQKTAGHRPEWLALVALLLVAALSVALVVLTTNHTAVPVPRPAPAAGKVAPVPGDGVRVGGTSVYRYHPLPAVNVGEPGGAGAAGSDTGGGFKVGGSGPYSGHPLP
jgi:hypothetical protein